MVISTLSTSPRNLSKSLLRSLSVASGLGLPARARSTVIISKQLPREEKSRGPKVILGIPPEAVPPTSWLGISGQPRLNFLGPISRLGYRATYEALPRLD